MRKSVREMLNSAEANGEPVFLLRAKDKCALVALSAYLAACEATECSLDQIEGVNEAVNEFYEFKNQRPNEMKLPG